MQALLTSKGIPLRPREYDSFINFAADASGEKIYYEDYIKKITEENDRHKMSLIKDFDNFKPKPAAK